MVLELRLVEEIVVGPAEGLWPPRRSHVADDAVIGADVQMAFRLAHVGRYAGDDAGGLQQAHRFVIKVDRARQRMRLELLLDHQHAQALAPEQVGGDRADRTTTDDDDVKRHRGRGSAATWTTGPSSRGGLVSNASRFLHR